MYRNKVAAGLAVMFILGLAYIVYAGRPVNNIKPNYQPVDNQASSIEPADQGSVNYFSLDEVASHSDPADCWSVVGGSVYDLSSWVSRHPGGTKAIIGMCGRDSSDAFNNKHGSSQKAQAALILLKIGELK